MTNIILMGLFSFDKVLVSTLSGKKLLKKLYSI